jgi:hypothetical protein
MQIDVKLLLFGTFCVVLKHSLALALGICADQDRLRVRWQQFCGAVVTPWHGSLPGSSLRRGLGV